MLLANGDRHDVVTCPVHWNITADDIIGYKDVSACPVLGANIFAVTPGNSEDIYVEPAWVLRYM